MPYCLVGLFAPCLRPSRCRLALLASALPTLASIFARGSQSPSGGHLRAAYSLRSIIQTVASSVALGSRPCSLKLMACAAAAQAVAHATLVPVKLGDNEDIPVYVGGEADAPSIIVIQEWWGVDQGTMQKTLRLAQHGYRVLVPDIYKGKKGMNAEEASHLMGELDFPKAIEEISIAAAYLKKTGSPAVGVVGFCMGGALALGALAASDDIVAGAPFYGVNFGLFDAKTLKKPVQGHFGALDAMEGFRTPRRAQGWRRS